MLSLFSSSSGENPLEGIYMQEVLLVKVYLLCYIYSTVGRSIANIYDLKRHIYQGAKRRGKYAAEVI